MQIDRAEIAQYVDLSALAEGTEVRAYTLVHEGESRPHDLDTGETLALRWGRAVVRRVAALTRAGTQFVRSHTDRTVVGELLGSFTKEVAGKLQRHRHRRVSSPVSRTVWTYAAWRLTAWWQTSMAR